MIYMNRSISLAVAFLAVSLFLVTFTLTSSAQTLYSCESPFGATNPFLYTVDPDTGATLTTTEITLEGETVRGCNGLAKDPTTGVCYMIVNVAQVPGTPAPRILAIIDVDTGVATEIGNTGLAFAGIAFTPDGTLYGLTGDQNGSAIPTIYTINKTNGTPTEFLPLVNTDDGEALGSSPIDGLLYRMNGRPPINVDQIFESINPANMNVSEINLSGPDEIDETTALTFLSGNTLLAGDTDPSLYTLTTNGVVNEIGTMDHVSKGLAFDCGVAPPPPPAGVNIPTLSEWGLIAMAAVLGIIGLFAARSRKGLHKV